MRNLLVFGMLFLASVSLAGDQYQELTVAVTGSEIVTLKHHYSHIAISTDAELSVRFVSVEYEDDGSVKGFQGNPYGDPTRPAGTGYPAADDTLMTVFDSTVTPWNIYNNINAKVINFTGTGNVKIRLLGDKP